nr:hypothetical protein GCM10020092_039290 [Actinoplanes digitatis]
MSNRLAPGDTYRPAPGGPQRAVPAATVPPEVREAIANWVEAQRRRQRACAQIGKELDEAQRRSGTGRSVSAVCSVDDIPAEFLPWLRRLGYDEGELSGRGGSRCRRTRAPRCATSPRSPD